MTANGGETVENIEVAANGHALVCGGVITGRFTQPHPVMQQVPNRYKFVRDSEGDVDYYAVYCRDCSSRTTSVVIPTDLIEEHEHVAHLEPTC
jgi:hypothetical protein